MRRTVPISGSSPVTPAEPRDARRVAEALLTTGALQGAIFASANFSIIATDAKGVIQLFNVGAERMLGYSAAEVIDVITPAALSDAQELVDRAAAEKRLFASAFLRPCMVK